MSGCEKESMTKTGFVNLRVAADDAGKSTPDSIQSRVLSESMPKQAGFSCRRPPFRSCRRNQPRVVGCGVRITLRQAGAADATY
jgi:hypothetical protein